MLLMEMTKLDVVGRLAIVKNCWPKELEREQLRVPEEVQVGLLAKRLLKGLCSEELITMRELEGIGLFPRVRVAVEVSPTKGEEAASEHDMV